MFVGVNMYKPTWPSYPGGNQISYSKSIEIWHSKRLLLNIRPKYVAVSASQMLCRESWCMIQQSS